jgi:hypothetical protein
MSIFKNKHVIMAMIMAPILAIASYYLVDLAVKEQPQKALEGNTYKLIAKSNCRFSSGRCDLENGSFKSTVRISYDNGQQLLRLSSVNELQAVNVGFVTSDGTESGPYKLTSNDDAGTQWSTEFNELADTSTLLRVALTANDAHYYSETFMGFSDYKTSFSKDFRKQN